MNIRKMPIGVQDFEKLITDGCVYVDKTALVYDLVYRGHVIFLSRPRRFGKSLLLSTIKQYFLGNKDLFKGLAIEKLEEENPTSPDGVAWVKHEVIYIDLNTKKFEDALSLKEQLDMQLETYEKKYGIFEKQKSLELRLIKIIRTAKEQSGRRVVFLVDEYDKPLLQTIRNPELFDDYRATLKAFYGVVKSEDAYLRFAMLTGVTKFSQVSVWSDLNNLQDISMNPKYSSICGITQAELQSVFDESVSELADENGMTKEECYAELKKMYDGYHFSFKSEDIYNPFSMLNTFENNIFNDYWFQTGTPTFLVEEIKNNNFDLKRLIDGVEVSSQDFTEYRVGSNNPIPILFQSGYLTINGYDSRFKNYHLTIPNEEVKYGFLNFLKPDFLGHENSQSTFDIQQFVSDVESGNVDAFMTRLQSIIASLPYPTSGDKRNIELLEYNFQVAVYLTFTLMGEFTQCEVHSIKGRADDIRCVSNAVDKFPLGKRSEATYAIVETKDAVYLFEFKTDDTPENALAQIDENGYAVKYKSDARKLVKIGTVFNTEKRVLEDWLVG